MTSKGNFVVIERIIARMAATNRALDGTAASCNHHLTSASNPLVAHCLTGALRTFPNPRVYSSIRENLVEAFSLRRHIFVVTSLDYPAGFKEYTTGEVDRALAHVGAESVEIVPTNHSPPAIDCSGAPSREKAFWYQQHKTRRCFEAVERFERDTGTCFDWVLRARPDEFWETRVPNASMLPTHVLSTGEEFAILRPYQNWSHTHHAAIEDHFMAVPRRLARAAMYEALEMWHDCRTLHAYERACPLLYVHDPFFHGKGRPPPHFASECQLGLHLREHKVRWRTDARLRYRVLKLALKPGCSRSSVIAGRVECSDGVTSQYSQWTKSNYSYY